MTFDHELILIGTEPGENELGDPILVPVRRLYCVTYCL